MPRVDPILRLLYMKGLENKSGRDKFSSSLGTFLALAGSAVGLGNIWRFPYLTGANGGAAFILIYLVAVLLIGLPLMTAEYVVGRRSQANAFRAFKVLRPKGHWQIIGILAVITCFMLISFYSVVGGWGVNYLVEAATMGFTREGADLRIPTMFEQLNASPVKPAVYMTIFLAMTVLIVKSGIRDGIEKFSKVMMPVLFAITLLLAIFSFTLPGAADGLSYLFKPDFSKVTSQTYLAALGQAFFSLSLGSGLVLTYASYSSKEDNILSISAKTIAADTLYAIIAGCAILPAVFSFGISPSEGPGLVFVTLPHIFSKMPFGAVAAILFFITLLLAALTSSISLLEVMTSYLSEEMHIKHKVAAFIATVSIWASAMVTCLSVTSCRNLKVAGMSIFDFLDYVASNIMLPLIGIATLVFVGTRLEKAQVLDELTNGGRLRVPVWLQETIIVMIRFVAPAGILALMIF